MIILNKSTSRIAARWEHNHQEIADKKRARNLALLITNSITISCLSFSRRLWNWR